MVSKPSHINTNIYHMDVNQNPTHNSRITTLTHQTYTRFTRRTNQYSMGKSIWNLPQNLDSPQHLKLIQRNDKEARKHHLLNRASAANLENIMQGEKTIINLQRIEQTIIMWRILIISQEMRTNHHRKQLTFLKIVQSNGTTSKP